MKGNIIRFDHHETGEEISAVVVGETVDGNLELKLHKDRTGERSWYCTPEEVKEVIGEVEEIENIQQMGRYNIQAAIEAAEEEGPDGDENMETIEELVYDIRTWADEEDHEGSPHSFGYGKKCAFKKSANEIEDRLLGENGAGLSASDVEGIINGLLKSGLSPGQAWAYYGVEVRGYSRNEWSEKCGYSDHSAVSEPLRKAKSKLAGDQFNTPE